MIQVSLFELILLLLSTFLIGCVMFSVFISGKTDAAENDAISDEEFIDQEARKRILSYETDSFLPLELPSQSTLDHLVKRIDRIEQALQSTASIAQPIANNNTNKTSTISSIGEEEELQEERLNADEEAFYQAKEELELAIYRAKKQVNKLREKQDPSSESTSQEHTDCIQQLNAFALKIDQLNQGLQSNMWTAEQLSEKKNKIEEDTEALMQTFSLSPITKPI